MTAVATDIETAAVTRALEEYIAAVEAHDLNRYAKIVSHDDELAWYGSAPGQIVGWTEVESVMRGSARR